MGFGFWEALIVSVICLIALVGLIGFGTMIYYLITDKKKND